MAPIVRIRSQLRIFNTRSTEHELRIFIGHIFFATFAIALRSLRSKALVRLEVVVYHPLNTISQQRHMKIDEKPYRNIQQAKVRQ
jgi:hypothetical protein